MDGTQRASYSDRGRRPLRPRRPAARAHEAPANRSRARLHPFLDMLPTVSTIHHGGRPASVRDGSRYGGGGAPPPRRGGGWKPWAAAAGPGGRPGPGNAPGRGGPAPPSHSPHGPPVPPPPLLGRG